MAALRMFKSQTVKTALTAVVRETQRAALKAKERP